MTIIPGQEIRKRCMQTPALFTPFAERTKHNGMSYGLSMAGYDVRIRDTVILDPREYDSSFQLASTLERIAMPADLLGIVHDKSSWARRGLSVFNTVIENGWQGWLTLELVNHSQSRLVIQAGDPIAQIILHRIDPVPEQVYDGKYQNQIDAPVPAIYET
jgi:dCTP deaminase